MQKNFNQWNKLKQKLHHEKREILKLIDSKRLLRKFGNIEKNDFFSLNTTLKNLF